MGQRKNPCASVSQHREHFTSAMRSWTDRLTASRAVTAELPIRPEAFCGNHHSHRRPYMHRAAVQLRQIGDHWQCVHVCMHSGSAHDLAAIAGV
jgi:hypothetical protein